jgi:cytochrome b561
MSQSKTYPRFLIAIHWLTLLLLLITVSLVLIRDEIDTKSIRLLLINNHRALGILIFAIVIVRILSKFFYRKQLPQHALPLWMRLAANLHHASIYLVLLALPILGWAQTSAAGKTASLFGLFDLPALIAEDSDLADTLTDYHEYAAWLLLFLVLTHAAAALWHHFVRKDDVMNSMLGRN